MRSTLLLPLLLLAACAEAPEVATWPDALEESAGAFPAPPLIEGPGPVDVLAALDLTAAPEARREALLLRGQRPAPGARGSAARVRVEDQREALVAPVGSSVPFDVEVGGRHAWSVDLAVVASSEGVSSPVGFLLEAEDDGARRQLWRTDVAATEAWTDHRAEIDLEPGRHWLTTLGHPEVEAAWGAPTLAPVGAEGRTVLLISIDTLRADHLGCYGYERPTSPHIDALAAGGVLFEDAISPSPWTLPAYGSLFTSRYPTEHRAGRRGRNANWLERVVGDDAKGSEGMREDLPTLAGVLGQAGVRSSALVSNPFLSVRRGALRGFDEVTYYEPDAAHGVDLALEWLAQNPGGPRLLFLHLIDPHYPYAPPSPYDQLFTAPGRRPKVPGLAELRAEEPSPAIQRWLTDRYDGEIAYADAQVGRLLAQAEARGLVHDPVVIVHADHGEELWDHGGFEHGHTMHRELLRVPLIVSAPGQLPSGVRVDAQVRALDVFPTLTELLGVATPEGLAGTSLLPQVEAAADGRGTTPLAAYSEGILWSPPVGRHDEAKSLSDGGWKVVLAGPERELQLYETAVDPAETRDRAATDPAIAELLEDRLGTRALELQRTTKTAAEIETDAEEQRALDHLGYFGED